MDKKKITMFADGAARHNPVGAGGFGTIVRYEDETGVHEYELSGGAGCTTNNRMELIAVIAGLESIENPSYVHVVTDSQYVVNAFNRDWLKKWIHDDWKTASNKPVKNRELWERLLALTKKHTVFFEWTRGHAGHPENSRCDELATKAADKFSTGKLNDRRHLVYNEQW